MLLFVACLSPGRSTAGICGSDDAGQGAEESSPQFTYFKTPRDSRGGEKPTLTSEPGT